MLSDQAKIEIIAEIIYEHIKGRNKDALSLRLATEIIDTINELEAK